MKTITNNLAALLLTIAFGAQADSYWVVNDEYNAAQISFADGLTVAVVFSEERSCKEPQLVLKGNSNISNLIVVIDGDTFTNSNGQPSLTHTKGVAYDIGDNLLDALKYNGSNAALVTNQGVWTMSLEGAGDAIIEAWAVCFIRGLKQ